MVIFSLLRRLKPHNHAQTLKTWAEFTPFSGAVGRIAGFHATSQPLYTEIRRSISLGSNGMSKRASPENRAAIKTELNI
jgi:hypothetical protein